MRKEPGHRANSSLTSIAVDPDSLNPDPDTDLYPAFQVTPDPDTGPGF
jgi:hypothetical protein